MLAGGEPWLEGDVGRALAVLGVTLATACAVLALRGVEVAGALPLACLAVAVSLVQTSLVLRVGERLCDAMGHVAVSACEMVVRTESVEREGMYRCRATIRTDDGCAGDVWATLPAYEGMGSTLTCVGRFVPNADDEWGRTSRMQGIWGSVKVVRVLASRPRTGLLALVDEARRTLLAHIAPESCEERALLAGCVCGARDGLVAFGLDKTFARCGISHLVAVSGGHMAQVSSLLAMLLLALRLSPVPRGVCTALACGAFVLLCGAPLSAVRAWAMSCMAVAGGWSGRRAHGLTGVCVVGLVMALLDPTICGQMGFVLSVCSVVGLCLFSAYASYALVALFSVDVEAPRWMPRRLVRAWRRARPGIREAIAASVVAQMATLPVAAEAFGEVSLVGPLCNVVVCLPFSAIMTAGVAAACLGAVPVAQEAALRLCDLLAHVLLVAVRCMASLPFASVDLGDWAVPAEAMVCVLAVGLLLAWPRVRRGPVVLVSLACVALACAQLACWRLFAPPRVCVLDVGQGDAVLVQDGAAAILVDAGPDESVLDALARNHVLHLDALVVTHLHADHYAGIDALAGKVACDEVLVAGGVAASMPEEVRESVRALTGGEPGEVRYGDVLGVGDFSLRVVWPREEVDGTLNAHSLELVATYRRGRDSLVALLTGDAEREETGSVLRCGDVADVDVLKVGHHGSAESVDGGVAAGLQAEVAVASAGRGNAYGHPTDACVRALEEAGSLFLCTMDVGDVTLSPGADGVGVRCQGHLTWDAA